MSTESHDPNSAPSDPPLPSEPQGGEVNFHTDTMIICAGVAGALATIGFVSTVILHFMWT